MEMYVTLACISNVHIIIEFLMHRICLAMLKNATNYITEHSLKKYKNRNYPCNFLNYSNNIPNSHIIIACNSYK